MEITLTPEIEEALRKQAERRGTTPEELALASLRQQFVHHEQDEHPTEAQGTLADFLGDSIGVLHSGEHIPGGAQMSKATGKSFTEILIEKRKRGRL